MRFDNELFGQDLMKLMKVKMSELANELLANMKREAAGVSGLPGEWLSELQNALDSSLSEDKTNIIMRVGLSADNNPSDRNLFIGYISNYGMGQYTDKSNPDLSNYKKSEFFNRFRGNDLYIYTRTDKYFDVDSGTWKKGNKSNKWTQDGNDTTPKVIESYGHHPAFYWYENSIKWLGGEKGIQRKIQDMLKECVRELNKNTTKYIRLN